MTTIKSPEEIKKLREGGKILASVLQKVSKKVAPGVVTIELDELAEKLIREAGGEPSFKNYKDSDTGTIYPASLCVSINNEIVHGIPSSERKLQEGDIVGLDLGMKHGGLYTDTAVTVAVGQIDEKTASLVDTAKKSLEKGIAVIKEGAHVGDIGDAVQGYAEENGFGVVRMLVGHGVGYKVHEGPEIPNYGKKGSGEALKEGMVLALEPMLVAGDAEIVLDKDNWTYKTKDGSLSAHFEHTVVVTKEGVGVLTIL